MNNFNPDVHYLGKLCPRFHEWMGTGKSKRYHSNNLCTQCCLESSKKYLSSNRDELRRKNAIRNRNLYHEKKNNTYKPKEVIGKEEHLRRKAEKSKRYREKYPERMLAYRLINKDRDNKQAGIRARLRRARKKKVHNAVFSKKELLEHKALFNNQCVYCGCKDKPLTIDHFIPISKGGPHCLGNLVPSCHRCNESKNSKDAEKWYKQQPFYSKKNWDTIIKVLRKSKGDLYQLPLF